MVSNFVIVTSVINTPNKPLSYSKTRSVFTRKERFEQTKLTFESVKKNIPNCKILLIECSEFTDEENIYFQEQCDYILNLWENKSLHNNIFGLSKSLGEGTMTIKALEYIFKEKIEFDCMYKICGRYWLNDDFKYEEYNNTKDVFKQIDNNINNIFTSFYKVTNKTAQILLLFLKKNELLMHNNIGYEVLFGRLLKLLNYNNVKFITYIGYEGNVTVCGSKYIG
tara:strand:- start:462 stop:1133 length:672 start_codon:yes stop_codon:yes gene_type:complete